MFVSVDPTDPSPSATFAACADGGCKPTTNGGGRHARLGFRDADDECPSKMHNNLNPKPKTLNPKPETPTPITAEDAHFPAQQWTRTTASQIARCIGAVCSILLLLTPVLLVFYACCLSSMYQIILFVSLSLRVVTKIRYWTRTTAFPR